jgi:PAS domain S-box-containing protein
MTDARRDFVLTARGPRPGPAHGERTAPKPSPGSPHIASIGRWLCLGGALLGIIGLLARTVGATSLVSVVPGQPPMMPNTALGLLLVGAAGALRRLPDPGRTRLVLARLAALVALAIGAGTLLEYALGRDLRIDQLLFLAAEGPFPGRPSPPTALALSWLATALLIFDVRPAARARPSEWLLLSAGVTAFIGLTGFVFGAGRLYRLTGAPMIGVAVPTAVSLLLTSVGLLLERPAAGLMGVATSPGSGGVMLRRLLAPAIVTPVLLGLAVVRASLAVGVEHDIPLVVASMTSLVVLVALLSLTVTAVALNRAEQALRLSEARSSGILSISADALISVDEDGRITMFNEGAEKIFGYSNAEALGAPLELLLPERFRSVHRRHLARFAEGDGGARRMGERTAAVSGLRKNGAEFPADAAISKLQIGGKRILTVALRDITEAKRIENDQRFLAEAGPLLATGLDYEQTALRLAQLAVREIAHLCIVDLVDAEGGIRWSKVVSRDPSGASACEALMHPSTDREHRRPFARVLEAEAPVVIPDVTPEALVSWVEDEDHQRAVRSVAPRSIIAMPLRAHGEPLGLVVLISSTGQYGPADLRMAEELAQRAALSIENARLYHAAGRAVQVRDDVLGIVAHDLRNPLGAILMQAGLLQRQASEPGHPARKPGEVIERAARRMNDLIQDLLDVTSIDAGRLSIEPSGMSARQLVSDALESQKPLASSSSIELRLALEQGVPQVWADGHRLLQVLENLIGNALKFTAHGGQVTVGASPRDGQVLFWVSDTGVGIEPEDLPHLFDRFWQGRKARRQGAGLGLPIVKGIVEAHGGRVWVESTPARGSTFFFTIPVVPEAAGSEPERVPGS